MKAIAVVYHCLFQRDGELLEPAIEIIHEQMEQMRISGMLDAATEFHVGINGGTESQLYAESMLPDKAIKVYHGLQCRNELRTLMLLQKVMKDRKDWAVFYFHSKGATHKTVEKMYVNWRKCMMHHLVLNWSKCVENLVKGFDSCGCHWLTGQVDGKQNLWGGNFWWATSEYLSTLAPIENHPRIPLMGGVDSEKSRFEAEVWIGSGPKLPKVADYHPAWPFKCPTR